MFLRDSLLEFGRLGVVNRLIVENSSELPKKSSRQTLIGLEVLISDNEGHKSFLKY